MDQGPPHCGDVLIAISVNLQSEPNEYDMSTK